MKHLEFGRVALSTCAAVAMLAGCGGSQPPIGGPGAMPQISTIARHAERGTSWMLPEAKGEDLLYITNYSEVSVLTYPGLKRVGVLKGFFSAAGECVDSDGNIYVGNEKPVAVYEYAHGSSKRVATFRTKHVGAIGCAIDPTTGNLAVTGSSKSVNIFEPGRKQPLLVTDPKMFFNVFCTYDDKGDLFVGGSSNASGGLRLAELPVGTSKFVGIAIGPTIDPTQNIQWDGTDLAALSFVKHGTKKKIAIAQLAISGTQATQVGSTPLRWPAYIVLQYFITKGTVIVPNLYLKQGQHATFSFTTTVKAVLPSHSSPET
jgi:hypothetical protein